MRDSKWTLWQVVLVGALQEQSGSRVRRGGAGWAKKWCLPLDADCLFLPIACARSARYRIINEQYEQQ
jgi:hypothetical protein